MSDAAVVFDGVWKKFRRGERHDSLRDVVPSLVRRALGRNRPTEIDEQHEFWAVKDVSFEVKQGEALGIIGPNGAGKSTTLKLLTRILRPTRGTCHVRGRVGALIEVAAGFHPDLTGRENIFLQGAIMGMKGVDIRRRIDEIVEFSGVGPFIDTPVKRYSSGMQARLGFSVAAHLDPDVLFIDEVLSVGDMSFQAKCLERMHEHVRAGVTLVFVSHNLQAVASLCKRAIVCAKGALLYDGRVDEAMTVYMSASQSSSGRHGANRPSFKLLSTDFSHDGAGDVTFIEPHRRCELVATLECLEDTADFNVGVEIERTRDLLYCYGVSSEELGQPLRSATKGDRLTIRMRFVAHLARGHYRVNLNLRQPQALAFPFVAESVANFTIREQVTFEGVVEVEPDILIEQTHVAEEFVQQATTA